MDQPNDPVAERARQRVGVTLKEKWRLDDLIGVGGMAAVYSATHRNGMRVAVKMLHTELSVDPEVRQRFLREGYHANKVDHPGAVAVLDDDVTDDGAVFLVMELLEGETLAHRFERKARTLLIEEILLIADKVLDILAAAHDKHIVHRDIKPDNIFLTRSGDVKVLDFGIARLREMSPQPKTSSTRSGSTMGTPAYMAPEQARARWDEVDGRTDLWSVGATMFKLLTGRVVHVADTINEQLLAAMTKPAPPLATLVPTVPIPVLEVVDKALQYTKEDRWADARAMQRAIREAYQAITGVAPTSVRLSFDDSEAVAHADTIVLSSTKMPTSLTAAHDSGDVPKKKRGSRPWGKIAWLLTLCGIGIGGYSYFSQRTAAGVDAPFGELDAGTSALAPLDFANPFASTEPSAAPAVGSAAIDPPGPSRVEAPPIVEPENVEPTDNTPAPTDSVAAPVKSVDDTPPPAPRPTVPPAAPVHPAVVTTPAPAPKPVTTATHKPAPPPPRPPAPVKRPPPPPPPAPRPFRRP